MNPPRCIAGNPLTTRRRFAFASIVLALLLLLMKLLGTAVPKPTAAGLPPPAALRSEADVGNLILQTVDAQLRPIAGVTISVRDQTADTGIDGRVTFNDLPVGDQAAHAEGWLLDNSTVLQVISAQTREYVVHLTRDCAGPVQLTDLHGQPAAGFQVTIHSANMSQVLNTDDSGRVWFARRGCAGWVQVALPDGRPYSFPGMTAGVWNVTLNGVGSVAHRTVTLRAAEHKQLGDVGPDRMVSTSPPPPTDPPRPPIRIPPPRRSRRRSPARDASAGSAHGGHGSPARTTRRADPGMTRAVNVQML